MTTPGWEELYRTLPDELRRYQLAEAWSHERLWALELPVEEMAVGELEWQLALPWWRHEGRFFVLRPLDVLAAPDLHAEQYARTLAADLSFPLDVTLRRGRWFVLDGVHRLLKARLLGHGAVAVRKLGAAELARIQA
jgi:hypothetical protein